MEKSFNYQGKNSLYVYFYILENQPELIRDAIPGHAGYWKAFNLPSYTGGLFVDRSGELIIFSALMKKQP